MLRLLIAGIAMIPAGIMITADGFSDEPTFPSGAYTGPIISILGVVLAIITGRNFISSDENDE